MITPVTLKKIQIYYQLYLAINQDFGLVFFLNIR